MFNQEFSDDFFNCQMLFPDKIEDIFEKKEVYSVKLWIEVFTPEDLCY